MSLSLENPCMPTIAVELSSSAFAPWLLYIVELELLRLRKLAMEDGTISKDEKKQMDEA